MALTEKLALLVTLDSKGAVQGLSNIGKTAEQQLGKADDRLSRVGATASKVGVGMVASGALMAGALFKAGQAASDLEQSVGGTEAVFKGASDTIAKFAKTADQSMGLSEAAFRTATSSIGGQLKGVGFSTDEAAKKSIELTQVAADLAATYGGTTAEAVQALGAAFRGEADPAERFNLRLNQNTVNAKAVSLGLAKSTSAVDAHAKAQATLALIMEQSKDAQGQFARESDTAAGAQARFQAAAENLKASLGGAVAPVMADVAGKLSGLVNGFNSLPDPVQHTVSEFATLATGGLLLGGGLLTAAGKALTLRDRFRDLQATSPKVAQGLGLVGKAAGVLAALQLGGTFANLVLPDTTHDLNELQKGLLDLVQTGKASGELAEITGENFDKLGESIGKVAKPSNVNRLIHGVFEPLGKVSGIDTSFDRTKRAIDELDKALAGLAQRDPNSATKALDALHKSLGDKDFERLRPLLNDYDSALAGIDVDARTAAGGVDQFGQAQGDAQDPTSDLTGQINQQTDALNGLLTATIASFDSNLAFRNAQDQTADSIAEVNRLRKEGKTGTDEYADALRSAEGDLLAQAAAAAKLAEDQAKASGKQWDSVDSARTYRTELINLYNSLAPGSPLRQVLQDYINQLAGIPTNITTSVTLHLGQSREEIERAKNPALFGPIGKSASGGTRAAGGPVMRNRPYLVGENGPELFVPSGNGNVTHSLPGGSMQALSINLTVNADSATNGKRVAREAMRELRKQVRARGGDVQKVLGPAA